MIVPKKSYAPLDAIHRHRKSKKIISTLKKFTNLRDCYVLDIGTGSGHIIQDICKICKSAASIDIYDERIVKSGYKFKKVKDEHIPFPDNHFDVVISNQIIEHVPNQELHITEIYRVLRKNGLLYLATPNKYWITDPHSRLPFISWLPRKLSSIYIKIVKGKQWDIYPLSYSSLKRLTKNRFTFENLTLKIIKNPEKYNLDEFKKIQPIMKIVPSGLLKVLNFIIPSYIIILRKK